MYRGCTRYGSTFDFIKLLNISLNIFDGLFLNFRVIIAITALTVFNELGISRAKKLRIRTVRKKIA